MILNSNTLEDSIDQYDSMIKEKALADPNPRDPRFLNVFPSSEMASWKRQWPVVPTFSYGGINYGPSASDSQRRADSRTPGLTGSAADELARAWTPLWLADPARRDLGSELPVHQDRAPRLSPGMVAFAARSRWPPSS